MNYYGHLRNREKSQEKDKMNDTITIGIHKEYNKFGHEEKSYKVMNGTTLLRTFHERDYPGTNCEYMMAYCDARNHQLSCM